MKIDLLILLLILFAGSSLYAQEEQAVYVNRYKAQELEKLGEFLKVAEMYEKSVEAEKGRSEEHTSELQSP